MLRLTHVETLLLLCTTRWGRENLRENGVYEIVRAAHEVESVDKVRVFRRNIVSLVATMELIRMDVSPDIRAYRAAG